MSERTTYAVANMIEMFGEEKVAKRLSDFSCPMNPEIESFIHTRAIDFAKRSVSMTHVVFDHEDRILGYFTLAHRPLTIPPESVSKSMLRKIATHEAFDEESGRYTASAYRSLSSARTFRSTADALSRATN